MGKWFTAPPWQKISRTPMSISDKCPGHPFVNFLDPPLKGTSKTLCREEPNMSTVFTKNIGMMALSLKKPWATCKGIG